MTNQNICTINDYRTNVQFTVKGYYIMNNTNQIPQEKIDSFINRINNLTDEQFERYINLLCQSNLISEHNGQKYLHQD